MNFQNPTSLTLGSSGSFQGCRYSVVGRVVMGMAEGGETYYWNEFNLRGDDGRCATLVYEAADDGAEWRMFTLFEPQNPISVQEAAAKRVGDSIELDGRQLRVTLVDESRVYHIEGEPPEGVEVGDVAHYFNAELRNLMIVVSWTGNEIEFYRGVDLPGGVVTAAFGLAAEATRSLSAAGWRTDTGNPAGAGMLRKFAVPVLMMVLGIGGVIWWNRPAGDRTPSPRKPKLATATLNVGAEGVLGGMTWRISGHAIMEVAEVGQRYDRHEYYLVDAAGNPALLVCGTKPGGTDWVLLTPWEPATPLTPVQAGTKRLGDRVEADGAPATITELFLSTVQRTDSRGAPELARGTILYGFAARSAAGPILVRWNAAGITWYRGQALASKDVKQAFARKPGQP